MGPSHRSTCFAAAAIVGVWLCAARAKGQPAAAPPAAQPDRAAVDRALAQRSGGSLQRACFVKRSDCVLTGDLDGDRRPDQVVLVRRAQGRAARGLAVLWGRGGLTVIGAGQALRVQPFADDPEVDRDAKPRPFYKDLGFLHAVRLLAAGRDKGRSGFRWGRRHPLIGDRFFPAPNARGHGILLDGSDASAVLYLNGKRWWFYELGF